MLDGTLGQCSIDHQRHEDMATGKVESPIKSYSVTSTTTAWATISVSDNRNLKIISVVPGGSHITLPSRASWGWGLVVFDFDGRTGTITPIKEQEISCTVY